MAEQRCVYCEKLSWKPVCAECRDKHTPWHKIEATEPLMTLDEFIKFYGLDWDVVHVQMGDETDIKINPHEFIDKLLARKEEADV